LLDISTRVLSLNEIARGCLGDELVLKGEHLRAADRATDDRLQLIIVSAMRRSVAQDTPTSIAIQRPSRLPLVIRAVRPDESAHSGADSAGLLLLALDPELRREPAREMLTQAFGLTRAEVDIALGIVSGKTLAEIAAGRDTTIETARAHAKAVFSKTQTRGQAELTGVLTRLAFLVPRMEGK
jgi:DNA-binding CsgD family transcriptional regulator